MSVITIGSARLKVMGVIANEPDQLGQGFRLGPPVITDLAGLDATRLLQPGSLYQVRYRMLLPPAADPTAVGKQLLNRFPNLGWSIRTPDPSCCRPIAVSAGTSRSGRS